MGSLGLSVALAASLSGLWLGAPSPALAAKDVEPGAYCPFPKAGEVPQCLVPAQDRYAELFAALDDGEIADRDAARVEADLIADSGSENAYLALSSLSYAYYRLAQRAVATPGEDPEVVARLERWNDLLARAYAANPEDVHFRSSVRAAAADIHERAPAVRLDCLDESGEPARCDSTEAVLRSLNQQRDETGIRGTLGRLLGRLFGGKGS